MNDHDKRCLGIRRVGNFSGEYLTTGQAAALCSVTPDTVLKWVNSGKLPARRTPGGHCRIHKRALIDLLAQRTDESNIFNYCWEYNSKGGEPSAVCRSCLVYRARASRCYEIANEIEEEGHAKLACRTPCEECEFYTMATTKSD